MAGRDRLVGVGIFVVGGVLLFAVGLFMIGSRRMAFSSKFTVYTAFRSITGLQPGATIRVSGARAGSVDSIAVPSGPDGRFRVRLEIEETLHPLVRTDSVASIRTEGLVGGSYLSVSAGSAGSPPAPDGSVIPSQEPFELADLMRQMSDTVRLVNTTISAVQADLEQTIASVADTAQRANELIDGISADVTRITASGVRVTRDVEQIVAAVKQGQGTLGKLVTDDTLYNRVVAIASNAEQISAETRQIVVEARKTLAGLQGQNGPVGDIASELKRTLGDARRAMAELADDMEALKHNFLLRGFFRDRGYFSLADVSPAEYLRGRLTQKGERRKVRVWLGSDVLMTEAGGTEALTAAGRARLESALAPYLKYLAGSPLVIEGYATGGTEAERYVKSRERAGLVRDYLLDKFDLDPRDVGMMPLGNRSEGSPGQGPWNGVALAVFLDRSVTSPPS